MKFSKKIYYYDTDCEGVVYYSNYLKYFEEGRTECLLEKGVTLKELEQKRILFVVRNVAIDYKSPARYGDTIEIFTDIKKVKNASLVFYQEARMGNNILVTGEVVLVCIDANFRPISIPKEVLACIGKC